jgi:hypothetical protein
MLVYLKYKVTSLEEYFHIARNRSVAARRSYLKDTRQSCSILSKMRLSKFLRSTYVFKMKNQPGHQQIDSEYLVCIVVFTCRQGLTRNRAPIPRFLMLSSTHPSTDKSISPYSFPFSCTSLQFLLYDSANPGYHAGPCIYRDKTDITAYRVNISFSPKHVVIVFSRTFHQHRCPPEHTFHGKTRQRSFKHLPVLIPAAVLFITFDSDSPTDTRPRI